MITRADELEIIELFRKKYPDNRLSDDEILNEIEIAIQERNNELSDEGFFAFKVFLGM